MVFKLIQIFAIQCRLLLYCVKYILHRARHDLVCIELYLYATFFLVLLIKANKIRFLCLFFYIFVTAFGCITVDVLLSNACSEHNLDQIVNKKNIINFILIAAYHSSQF